MRRDAPSRCSLLVRNLHKDTRESDLRYFAEKYGPVRDVYLPRDYYTRELRGIGFIEYTNPRDAEDAKYELDKMVLLGREISVVFAMQGRKRPDDYRQGYRRGGGPRNYPRRARSPPRARNISYSPPRHRSTNRGYYGRSPVRRDDNHSPRRSHSRSWSPPAKRYSRDSSHEPASGSRSPAHSPPRRKYSRTPSPKSNGRSPSRSVSENVDDKSQDEQ